MPTYDLPEFPEVEASVPDFIEDSPELLTELYEYDFKWGRFQVLLQNLGSTTKEIKEFKEVLWKYYLPLKNVFLVLQSQSADMKNIEVKQYVDFCNSI